MNTICLGSLVMLAYFKQHLPIFNVSLNYLKILLLFKASLSSLLLSYLHKKSFQFVKYCLIRFTQMKIMVADIRHYYYHLEQPIILTFKVKIKKNQLSRTVNKYKNNTVYHGYYTKFYPIF